MEIEPRPSEEVSNEERTELSRVERPASRVPQILTIIALLLWFGFQTIELAVERSHLTAFRQTLEGATQEAQKIQAQLQGLITKTAELAAKGHPGAKKAAAELEKRGIPIRPTQ